VDEVVPVVAVVVVVLAVVVVVLPALEAVELVAAGAPVVEPLVEAAPGTRPSWPSAWKMLSMKPSMPPPRLSSPPSSWWWCWRTRVSSSSLSVGRADPDCATPVG
jgi:hypothetical protein